MAGDKPAVEEVAGPGEGVAVARVLQLADVHVDLSYSPGSPAACGLPCCCMNSTGQAAEGEAAAGPWGEYSCDIPLRTLDTLLAAAREQELDYIIYTGDSPAHDVWKQSKDRNLENELTVLDLIDSNFPGVPVYLGNNQLECQL